MTESARSRTSFPEGERYCQVQPSADQRQSLGSSRLLSFNDREHQMAAARYATPAEAAAFYSVSLRTVYNWINSGALRAVRIGRTLRVDLEQFEAGEAA